MKRNKFRILAFAVLFTAAFSSCVEDELGIDSTEVDNLQSDVVSDAAFGDVDDLTGLSMILAEGGTLGGRVAEEDDRFGCANVSFNEDLKQIIIDFGEGCEDLRGHVRSGAIIIIYTGPRFVSGSIITVTFEDYYFDGIKIQGVRTLENITEDQGSSPKYHVTLENGKLTFEDETFITREIDEIRTWVRGANILQDEYHVTGTASGTSRDGITYSMLITDELVWKVVCVLDKVYIPVSGVKQVTRGINQFEVDFGDGECDNKVRISSNGASVEVDLTRE